MKQNLLLPGTSLLCIVLLSFHFADDIAYGSEKGIVSNLIIVAVLSIFLYGTVALPERRSGHIIMLIGSLCGLVVFATHLTGTGGLAGIHIGILSGPFFFVWTLLALAVVSLLLLALATQGLWKLLRTDRAVDVINR